MGSSIVGTHHLMLIGRLGASASVSTFFTLNVVDDCSTAQLTAQDISTLNYDIGS